MQTSYNEDTKTIKNQNNANLPKTVNFLIKGSKDWDLLFLVLGLHESLELALRRHEEQEEDRMQISIA